MFRPIVLAALVVALPSWPCAAEPRRVMDAEAPAFGAVGRIGHADRMKTACTAVLIAPDAVLTATHCVASAKTGAVTEGAALEFRAGGAAMAGLAVAMPTRTDVLGNSIVYDVALVRLAGPVQGIVPLPLADRVPAPGETLASVGFVLGLEGPARIDTDCLILAAEGPVATATCPAVAGLSGGPLLRKGGNGWEVAAIMVAKGREGSLTGVYAVVPEAGLLP
jgi:V8-like Glu-specific endopeptidase